MAEGFRLLSCIHQIAGNEEKRRHVERIDHLLCIRIKMLNVNQMKSDYEQDEYPFREVYFLYAQCHSLALLLYKDRYHKARKDCTDFDEKLPSDANAQRHGERERMLRAVGLYAATRRDIVLQAGFDKETEVGREFILQAKACSNRPL